MGPKQLVLGVSGYPPSNIADPGQVEDATEQLRIDELITAASMASIGSRWETSPHAIMSLEVVLYAPLDDAVLNERHYIEGILAVLSQDAKVMRRDYERILQRDQVRQVVFKREISHKVRYQVRITSGFSS